MTPPAKIAQLTAAALAGGALATGGYALASSPTNTIHGCVEKTTHALTITKRCNHHQTTLTWNQRGPTGPAGRTGAPGATGAPGPAGPGMVGAWAHIAVTPTTASETAGQNLNVSPTVLQGSVNVVVQGGSACSGKPKAVVATPGFVSGQSLAPGDAPVAFVGQVNASDDVLFVTVGLEHAGVFTGQGGVSDVNVVVYCAIP